MLMAYMDPDDIPRYVVDLGGDVVGLCQKGRKTTARKNGIAVESDSRCLRLRNFAALLHGIEWNRWNKVSAVKSCKNRFLRCSKSCTNLLQEGSKSPMLKAAGVARG